MSEVVSRIRARLPLFEREIFGNEHDEVAEALRAIMDQLPRSGARVRFFEIPSDREFRSVDEEKRQEISSETLHNILAAHDLEIAETEQGDGGD